MNRIAHNVVWQKQGAKDCAQTSASVLLNAVGRPMTPDEIKKDVPVFVNSEGVEIGTSWPHLASFLRKLGYEVTMHAADIELLDPSWSGLSAEEMKKKLHKRRKHIRHPYFSDDAISAYFDGYEQYLSAGGRITFPVITENYLYKLLQKKPFIAAVSHNYLNSTSKKTFDQKSQKWSADDIAGHTLTHAVVVSGYDAGMFLVIDAEQPSEKEGARWLDSGHLIGAICLAETEWDNIVITIE